MPYNPINNSSRAALDGEVVNDVWTSNRVNHLVLRVFVCLTYVYIVEDEKSNFIQSLNNVIFWNSIVSSLYLMKLLN